jgi:O-antigen/teichoic acid export membrane protein
VSAQFKKVLTQTSFQLFGKAISSLSTLLVLAVITRNYGESGTGIFTLSLTYLTFFYLAADLGINAYILPKLSEDSTQANKLFNLRFFWSILLVIMANFLLLFLPFSSSQFNFAVMLGSATIILTGIFNSVNLIFQTNLKYQKSIIASSLGSLAAIPAILFLVYIKVPVGILILAVLFSWVINNIFSLILVKNLYKFSLSYPTFSYLKNLFKNVWPISLSLVLNVIYFRIDAFIISYYYSFADVGSYNLAYQVFQNILVIPTFIMNSYYPMMINLLNTDKSIFFHQIKKAALILFGLSLIISALTYLLAPAAILLLAGDKGFTGSSDVLKILALSLPAYFVSSILMWTQISLKKFKSMLVIYLTGVVVNVLLNLIFIPKYSFYAAAYITGISEYLILLMQIIILFPLMKKK